MTISIRRKCICPARPEEWVAEGRPARDAMRSSWYRKFSRRTPPGKGPSTRARARLPVSRPTIWNCYLLHWRTDAYPLHETIEAFDKLQREGKISVVGSEQFRLPDLKEAHRFASGRGPVLRSGAVSHSGAGGGARCDSVVREEQGRAGGLQSGRPRRLSRSAYGRAARLLKQIAGEIGATPGRWRSVFCWVAVFVCDSQASDPEHVAENARAGDVQLTAMQIARLGRSSRWSASPVRFLCVGATGWIRIGVPSRHQSPDFIHLLIRGRDAALASNSSSRATPSFRPWS